MKNSSGNNPYAAPRTDDDAPPVANASSSAPARWRLPLLFIVLALSSPALVFCLVWFSMAAYELATLNPDAYGQHTWRFRNSYLRDLGTSGILGILSFMLCRFSLRRGRRPE